jgi:2'-5' RNA ligase
MSRFFVGLRLKGEDVNEYYVKITAELEKFKIRNLSKRVAPHLTLKPPFESSQIDQFEKILEKLADDQKINRFEMEGFGVFEHDTGSTIFLKVKENEELEITAQKIVDEIRDFGENRRILPEVIKLHASIARHLNENQKREALEYLNSKLLPKFNLEFNNLTIFEYFPGGWSVYKEFKF